MHVHVHVHVYEYSDKRNYFHYSYYLYEKHISVFDMFSKCSKVYIYLYMYMHVYIYVILHAAMPRGIHSYRCTADRHVHCTVHVYDAPYLDCGYTGLAGSLVYMYMYHNQLRLTFLVWSFHDVLSQHKAFLVERGTSWHLNL